MKSSTLAFGALLLLMGCASVDSYYEQRSAAQILAESAVAADTRKEALPKVTEDEFRHIDSWWLRFNDETLTRLLAKAYAANRTLDAARANLRAAHAAWDYQRGTLYPTVDLGGDILRNRTSENGLSGRRRYTNYNLALGARWEIDLFGRQQYAIDAAAAQAEATEADLKALWVAVASNVAAYYMELRSLQGRLMVAEDNQRLQQANYELLSDRNRAGITNELQKHQAEYDLRKTSAAIPSLKAQIVAAEDSLALLCGVTPGTLPAGMLAMPQVEAVPEEDEKQKPAGLRPVGIPKATRLDLSKGIPANAIRRRPDVIAAERRLLAATATTESARMEEMPSVYITGSFGLDSVHLGDLLDWDSHFYTFGPGISLPIFRGGQIRANITITTEQQRAALADYEQTILAALADVRTSLSGLQREEERLAQLRFGVEAAQTAYEIASNKYNAGIGDFFDVLDAQRQLFSLDEARVISEGNIARQEVALYKSLCGGWDGEENALVAETLFGAHAADETLLSGNPHPEALLAPIAEAAE